MIEFAEAIKEAKEAVKADPIRVAYARLFTTPDGEVVLNNLKEQFYSCILTGPNSSNLSVACKAAQHDVIAVILQLIGDQK